MDHPFWHESLCMNQYLHRFSIKEQYPEGVVEVCEICHMKKVFRILDNKVNNYHYMKFHMRQALQPNHPYYSHEYN